MKLTVVSGTTYLDHAGTTLYPKSLIDAFSEDLKSSLLGNPHSASTSSQLSTRRIENVRLRVLDLFNANPHHYDLIFVANATAGIKLVLDGFREEEHGFWYGYHVDSHTSLVGVRESAQAGQHCFGSDGEVDNWLDGTKESHPIKNLDSIGLFAYPAQSNMNGRRLPLSWTGRLRSTEKRCPVYSLLDAAALVSTSPLDFGNVSTAPDFTVLSFYKMFGFPDLGALIVRKESSAILEKRKYFGGGTVEMVTCGKENWHIKKQGSLHDQLEDGTLPVHNIIALDNAMDVHGRLFGSFEQIASHTNLLVCQLHSQLSDLRHVNNSKVCYIYEASTTAYSDARVQGPVVAFNLRGSSGDWVSNTELEKLASIRSIQLRTGGLCNPGGTASSLNLQPWEIKRNFSAGYRCGNENDVIESKPTGVIRVSLGAMSNMQDVETFVAFVEEFFVDKENSRSLPMEPTSNTRNLYIETLTVYPIKSCGGWPIPSDLPWEVREEGLAWDREWCLVHQGTHEALSQKKYPKMALLRPSLEFATGVLRVRYQGPIPPSTPSEITVPLSADPSVFQNPNDGTSGSFSQVCGDSITTKTYVSQDVTNFFTSLVGTPCTLARFAPSILGSSSRHSKARLNATNHALSDQKTDRNRILLSNESPILTISRSSLNQLNEQIKSKEGKAAHASVFRANIVVAQDLALSPGSEQPYVEDDWQSLQIEERVKLDVLGGCRRCQMVCVDQHSAEKNEEPFVTLAKTRRKKGMVFFGVHTALSMASMRPFATIQVGNKVVPIRNKASKSDETS